MIPFGPQSLVHSVTASRVEFERRVEEKYQAYEAEYLAHKKKSSRLSRRAQILSPLIGLTGLAATALFKPDYGVPACLAVTVGAGAVIYAAKKSEASSNEAKKSDLLERSEVDKITLAIQMCKKSDALMQEARNNYENDLWIDKSSHAPNLN